MKELFNKRLKSLRQGKGWTTQQVADYLGMETAAYRKCEAGGKVPSKEELVALQNLYQQENCLLMAQLPIRTRTLYPDNLLTDFEKAICKCKQVHKGDAGYDLAFENMSRLQYEVVKCRQEAYATHVYGIVPPWWDICWPTLSVTANPWAERLLEECKNSK